MLILLIEVVGTVAIVLDPNGGSPHNDVKVSRAAEQAAYGKAMSEYHAEFLRKAEQRR